MNDAAARKPNGRHPWYGAVIVSVAATTILSVAVSSAGATDLLQLTNQIDCGSFAPSTNATGDLVAFESTCDLTGDNADGNTEIFQVDLGGNVVQLTFTAACTNSSPVSDAAGTHIAFESDCDIGGGNSDGNVEIVEYTPSGAVQLTDSTGCNSFAPSISGDGGRVFFDSDCDYTGANLDGSNEIFRVDTQGGMAQITDDTSGLFCGSYYPSSSAAGDRVAFESDCDLAGTNPGLFAEIFVDEDAGGITQLTFGDDDCASYATSLSGTGLITAFESDCDLTGGNPDGSLEIFKVDSLGGVTQLTDHDGVVYCESYGARVGADGATVVFSSDCDLAAGTGYGPLDAYVADATGPRPLTHSAGACFATDPVVDDLGKRAFWSSTCDEALANADASSEIFSSPICACGAPQTRYRTLTLPTASDALMVLRSAVGQIACDLCECDVNDSGSVTSTDALSVLRSAVGQQVPLNCPL